MLYIFKINGEIVQTVSFMGDNYSGHICLSDVSPNGRFYMCEGAIYELVEKELGIDRYGYMQSDFKMV
jgi:hypothetical protein